jgi:hypothetical protein
MYGHSGMYKSAGSFKATKKSAEDMAMDLLARKPATESELASMSKKYDDISKATDRDDISAKKDKFWKKYNKIMKHSH